MSFTIENNWKQPYYLIRGKYEVAYSRGILPLFIWYVYAVYDYVKTSLCNLSSKISEWNQEKIRLSQSCSHTFKKAERKYNKVFIMGNEVLGSEIWVTFLLSLLLYFIYVWGDTLLNHQKINFILNQIFFHQMGLIILLLL